MDDGLGSLLWFVFFIIPIILLLWSWVFGSRIGDKPFSKKNLKGGIFLLYIFFSTF